MLRFAPKIVGLVAFILLAGGFMAAPSASAQTPAPDWSPVYPPVSANNLNNVECRNEQCFAVGTNGAIVYSLNAGMDWQRSSSDFYTSTLYGIACASPTTCYATGENGLLLKTTNTGTDWLKQDLGITATVRAVACSGASQCYAFAENGAFFQTTGGNWTQVSVQNWLTGTLLSCPAAGVCYANGTNLRKTTDGGVTWDDVWGTVNSLHCIDAQVCYIVQSQPLNTYEHANRIQRTDNGGTSWTQVYSATGLIITDINCTTATSCFFVTAYQSSPSYSSPNNNSPIYYTTDGGTNWRWEYMNSFSVLKAISCLDTQRCIAIGGSDMPLYSSATIIGTNSGGKIWTKRDDSLDNPLLGVSCPIAETCYAVGARGATFKTTDNSFSWYQQTAPISTTLYGITCPSAILCVAVGENGKVRYTTDGTNWNSTSTGQQDLYGISCVSTTECVAVGANGAILRMGATPGATWTPENSGTNNRLFAINCPTSGTCYVVGENGTLLRKSGGGWVAENSGTTLDLRAISCPTTTTCYASEAVSGSIYSGQPTQGGRVISTTDGTNWTASSQLFLLGSFSIFCPNTLVCYAGGLYGVDRSNLISTTNAGATWRGTSYTAGLLAAPMSIFCSDLTKCVAVGTSLLTLQSDNGISWGAFGYYGNFFTILLQGSCHNGSTTCIATGSSPVQNYMVVSKDNGASWRTILFPKKPVSFLTCPTAQVCYAGTSLKSVDGGQTWQQINSTPNPNLSILRFDCPAVDICYGYGRDFVANVNRFWRTTNSGSTWISSTIVEGSPSPSERGLECPTPQICYALFTTYGNSNPNLSIYKTADSGLTWTFNYSTTTITNTYVFMTCPSEQTCYAFGTNGKYVKTTNGGTNWEILQVPPDLLQTTSGSNPEGTSSIGCVNETVCLVGSMYGKLLATRDGGNTWKLLPQRTRWTKLAIDCGTNGICRAFGDGAVIVQGRLPVCSLTVSKTVDDGTCGTLRAAVESAISGENIIFDLGVTTPTLQLSSNLTVPSGVNLVAANCASPKVTVQGTNNPTLKLSGSSRLEGWLFNGVRLQATSGGTMPNMLNCVKVIR